LKKILIANRAEIACRIIRSCRRLGIASVAVYSDVDAGAMHAALADEAVAIGGSTPAESYLQMERILDAARATKADGIHPGYGFLSENAEFAVAVRSADITWIGPDAKSIEDMGDKERARQLAAAAGIPVLPGSPRFAFGDVAGIREAAAIVGYPLLVKAASGGGGIGMRAVERSDDLVEAVERAQSMAQRAFGDGSVYFERFVPEARHVEVQVFGLGDGRAMHLFERDCSVQRRFQKVIEESPAPGLSEAMLERMYECAVALCGQERYRGAGTIEFIVDAQAQCFYFLEMNTRIQVEHPVTELTTGLDLVAMQIQHAAGRLLMLAQEDIRREGHAIECRLYAERPAKGFLPSPGVLKKLQLPPTSAEVRIDTGVREGDRITHYYDPMIAKIAVRGEGRPHALSMMLSTLAAIHIEGVETNLTFLRNTLEHETFQSGRVRTNLVERHRAELVRDRA
jgi:3-methylcrotonyl-CoA carboxylase alpha subunit